VASTGPRQVVFGFADEFVHRPRPAGLARSRRCPSARRWRDARLSQHGGRRARRRRRTD
jgi:hypothetical protein